MKIFMVYADKGVEDPSQSPYPVRAKNEAEVRAYFAEEYRELTVRRIEEYTGDPLNIEWFW